MPDLVAAPEELDVLNNRENLVVELYQNDLVPTPQTTAEDLVPCDFDGYEAADPAGFGVPSSNVEESVSEMEAAPLTFTKVAGDKPNTAYGCSLWLKTTAGKMFIKAERFPFPYPMVNEGDEFTIRPRLLVTDFEFPEL